MNFSLLHYKNIDIIIIEFGSNKTSDRSVNRHFTEKTVDPFECQTSKYIKRAKHFLVLIYKMINAIRDEIYYVHREL